MEDKRFFWIKLKTDFFQEDSPIDFLLSQPKGSEYVVIYLSLCLQTANSNGEFKVSDIKDYKYFAHMTVAKAISFCIVLGLIYKVSGDTYAIANYSKFIGGNK